jgi:alcohol dehydrogenase class IV
MIRQYHQSTPVIFGIGAISTLGEKLREWDCDKVLCVCDGGVKAAGISDRAESILKAAGIDYAVFDEVSSDPQDKVIDRGGEFARTEKVRAVVGIGGGSSLDAAKAIALLLEHPGSIIRYMDMPPKEMKVSFPIVLIPTTAGTGSEASDVGIITPSRPGMMKLAVGVKSTLAILDPELTRSVPPAVTAYTGMDALSHAVEAITANNRNPYAELLAAAAISKIVKYLPAAFENGEDMEARTNLCLAANWAGIALNDAGCTFGHCMSDALTAVFRIPHGFACALATPGTVTLSASGVPDKIRVVGEAMGISFAQDAGPEDIVARIVAALHALMREIGIQSLFAMGYTREATVASAPIAAGNGLRFNSPVTITPKIAEDMMGYIYDSY